MNKNKEYIKNTMILLLGKFATQFISFFLLPIYTHYLMTSDYGTVDLLQTYISLLVPVLILRLDSAVFRFLIDERNKKDDEGKSIIITNVVLSLIITSILFIFIYIILGFFIKITYYWYLLFNVIVLMFSSILLQISRGVGDNKTYSIACVLTSLVTLLVNVILIIKLGFNASSILIASIIANIVCIIYLFIKNKIYKYLNINKINIPKLKELLKYALPMIPNGLSWWIVNVSDRTIISYFIGTAMNGIYTVSCKFSNLLNNIFSIFNMSWQESASIHIKDDDRDIFFTDMINQLLNLFMCVSLIILVIIPIFFNILIGNEYMEAFNYIPILLFANIFNIITQLIGAIYIANKMTKKVMNTTIISAIINLIINFIFIHWIGLYAASISTLIAYLSIAIYRYIDVQKYVNINLNWRKIVLTNLVFLISAILYYFNNSILNIVNAILVVIYSAFSNAKNIKNIIKLIKR